MPSNSPTPIEAVIFDVGNVLYGWDPQSFLRRQIPDDAARLRFVADVDLFNWHETLDSGRSFEEASAAVCSAFPAYARVIAAWGENFGEMVKEPILDVHEIVRDLHRQGVPLFAITNFSRDFWKPFRRREAPFFSMFRDIVVSGEVKLLKPDPAIYHLALDRFGIHPSTALFTDDRLINVEAAVGVGMQGHLFTNAADLRARLSWFGLT